MTLTASIITPSYNQGRYIERTVRSVLRQSIPDLEYVVFDGGSTDQTLSILQRYEGRLTWVSEPDRGQSHAVNKGLLATSGEVIGWLNSDDIYYPGAIRAACAFLEEHPDVDVVYGDAAFVDEDDGTIGPYPTEPWDPDRLAVSCYLCQPATFFRRRVVERHGLLDERLTYCMDYEYWLRLVRDGARFAYLRRLQAGARLHQASKSVASNLECHRATNDILRATRGRVPDSRFIGYAYAVLEEKGFGGTNALQVAVMGSALSCYASLRWNHGITRNLLRTTVHWVGGAARSSLTPRLRG